MSQNQRITLRYEAVLHNVSFTFKLGPVASHHLPVGDPPEPRGRATPPAPGGLKAKEFM